MMRTEGTTNPFGLPRGEAVRREQIAVFREQHEAILRFLRTGRKVAAEALDGPGEQLRILESIRKASNPGARLLLLEGVVPPGDTPHMMKMVDLTMLGMLPGRERTEPEFRTLLEQAGFTLDRVVPTPTVFSIVEASVNCC